jgi:hypothetical protein
MASSKANTITIKYKVTIYGKLIRLFKNTFAVPFLLKFINKFPIAVMQIPKHGKELVYFKK